jgi:putative nucleotidyltransferase with HDIG domain
VSTTSATEFLLVLARTLSALGLYPEGHASRERVIDEVYEKLRRVLEDTTAASFGFLDSEVVFQGLPLRELRDWEWAARLPAAGVQSLEIEETVTRGELEEFLEVVLAGLGQRPPGTAHARPTRSGAIRWGAIGLRDRGSVPDELASATIALSLVEEADTVQWIHGEIARGRALPLAEAEAVVRSLAVAMHGDQRVLLPLLQLREFDEYTTTHSLNVSVLAMALAEWMGLDGRDVRAFGVAGLLHDLGKVRVPADILTKPGKLTPQERELMDRHPVDGAEIILRAEPELDLAAVVAYEHHVMLNGGGYPTFTYARTCHLASRLVHVCDVYDALRTDRPYRDAWEQPRILAYLADRSGSEFEPDMAQAFTQMMRDWELADVRAWRAGD